MLIIVNCLLILVLSDLGECIYVVRNKEKERMTLLPFRGESRDERERDHFDDEISLEKVITSCLFLCGKVAGRHMRSGCTMT